MATRKRTRLEAAVAKELPKLRRRIRTLRRQADGGDVHSDLASVYRKDADDLEAVAGACRNRDWAYAQTLADRLDTAVRDELGRWLYEGLCALADAPREPQGIDEQVLFDALQDNLSPQAVAAIVAYLQPAKTSNTEVNRQLGWLAERLTELVGGPDALNRLTDELGL